MLLLFYDPLNDRFASQTDPGHTAHYILYRTPRDEMQARHIFHKSLNLDISAKMWREAGARTHTRGHYLGRAREHGIFFRAARVEIAINSPFPCCCGRKLLLRGESAENAANHKFVHVVDLT